MAARLAGFFPHETLSTTHIARVDRIRNAMPLRLSSLAPRGMLDLSTVRGMAFIDTIVLADANRHAGDDETSLVFHELVHIVQYRLLGTVGFIRAYLLGWLENGRSYMDNPLEAMAFDLQDRFDQGERVDVGREVHERLRINRAR